MQGINLNYFPNPIVELNIKDENPESYSSLPELPIPQRRKYQRRKDATGFDVTKLIQKRERPKVREEWMKF